MKNAKQDHKKKERTSVRAISINMGADKNKSGRQAKKSILSFSTLFNMADKGTDFTGD
jgi:hypothetical protein